jgi:hypothetical protein
MQSFIGSLIALAIISACADRAHRKDQLFGSWQDAQPGVKSLIVEFTLETKDATFGKTETFRGAFRLLCTPKDEVFASYELSQPEAKAATRDQCSGLLSDGMVYILDRERKTAIKFDPADTGLRPFLERYFNPFVLLLDRKRAEEKCQLEVSKIDEWYTYLVVKSKHVKRYGWFPDTFQEGRVVLMNKPDDDVPKDMPCELSYTNGIRTNTFHIKSWRLNAADAPKLEEFTKPEDRPGWEVSEWLRPAKK